MENLPVFLRECEKVPYADLIYCGKARRSRRRHRNRRQFELVVNLETLLVTKDAGELLFGIASEVVKNSIIWFSDHIYMTTDSWNWYGEGKVYNLDIQFAQHSGELCVCHMPSSIAVEEEPSLVSVTDCLLRLLAMHKNIGSIDIRRESILDSAEPFPVMPSTLKSFVSDARSPRKLCFDEAGLSIEQWRAIAFNCNPNVTLDIRYTAVFKIAALSEAMNRNQCPGKMELHFFEFNRMLADGKLAVEIFHGFCVALGSTTSLKDISLITDSKECLISLFKEVARNQGLERLQLAHLVHSMDVSDAEWELLCAVLCSHPTLKAIEVFNFWLANSSCSPERDDIFIQYISKNTILRKLHFDYPSVFFHNFKRVKKAISPVLELNRVQSVVQAITIESNPTRRRKRFTTTLLCDKFCQRPLYCFLLVKENSDLLAELSLPENVLFPIKRNRVISRVLGVEERMQSCERLPPSLEPLLGKKQRR